MIHHYAASWTSSREKMTMFLIRHRQSIWLRVPLGILKILRNSKAILRFKVKRIYYKYYKSKKRLLLIEKQLKKLAKNTYIAIHHPKWLGVSISTKELFKHTLKLEELRDPSEALPIAKMLCAKKPTSIFFSGIAEGWIDVIQEIKKLDRQISIKVIWHGSNALLTEDYDFKVFMEVLEAQKNKYVDQIAFVKKSMYEFYLQKGFNVSFLMNTVKLEQKNILKPQTKTVKIGLYSSGNRWVKNTYNQLAAASLLPNHEIDCLPMSTNIEKYSKLLKINTKGNKHHLSRDALLKKLSLNDLNMYVTFTECAPLLPLESFELRRSLHYGKQSSLLGKH